MWPDPSIIIIGSFTITASAWHFYIKSTRGNQSSIGCIILFPLIWVIKPWHRRLDSIWNLQPMASQDRGCNFQHCASCMHGTHHTHTHTCFACVCVCVCVCAHLCINTDCMAKCTPPVFASVWTSLMSIFVDLSSSPDTSDTRISVIHYFYHLVATKTTPVGWRSIHGLMLMPLPV